MPGAGDNTPNSPVLRTVLRSSIGATVHRTIDGAAPRAGGAHPAKVIVVIDNPDELDLVVFLVQRAGYQAIPVADPRGALERVLVDEPAAVIVGIPLAGVNWQVWLRSLRLRSNVPVLALCASPDEDTVVAALEAGADEIGVKPRPPQLLRAQLGALLRRAAPASTGTTRTLRRRTAALAVDGLVLDPTRHVAAYQGRRLALTPTEWRLLHLFLIHPNQVLTLPLLLRAVWKQEEADRHALDGVRVAVSRLRRKLIDAGAAPGMIETVRGVGYALRRVQRPHNPDEVAAG